jgi:hypothetical protein
MAILKLAHLALLIVVGSPLLGCSKKLAGDTSFAEAKEGFSKELSRDQRKAAIKQLQAETAGDKR